MKKRYVCFITGKGTYAVPAGDIERELGLDSELDDKLLVQAVDYLPRDTYLKLLAKGKILKTGQPPRDYIPYVAYI